MSLTSRRKAHLPLLAIATLSLFAALAGLAQAAKPKPVNVYPVPGTAVISDRSTISFRDVNPKRIKPGKIKVIGARSGVHKGKKLVHSDRRGASFVPTKKFTKGERVWVRTTLPIRNGRKGNFSYVVGRFTSHDDKPLDPKIPPTTGTLKSRPDLAPSKLDVTVASPDAADGAIFYAPKQDGLVIADKLGRTTWFKPYNFEATGITLYNFRAQTYRGQPVLTFWRGASSTVGYSQIGTYEIMNRRYETIARVTPGNGYKADIHEFELTNRNTALVLSYVGVKKDLRKAGGVKNGRLLDNVIQEIDIKTGAVLFEWHSMGNVGFTSGVGAVPKKANQSFDYFHANSIEVDGDGYLISGRRHSTIYRVDRASGKIRWRLAGNGGGNSFKMGPGTEFGYQHDARRMPNGEISLFDNANGQVEPSVRPQSSILVLKLSGKTKATRTATLVKRYEHPTPVIAESQGNGELLANGGFFVGWGQVPQMTEFNAAGDVVFDATHDGAVSSYRNFKMPWNGIPQGKPAIASEASDGGTKVWASWNGSQATVQWKVLSGPDANNLSEIASSEWKDFETEIDAPAAGAVIAVQAVDAGGKVIGQSNAVPVGTQDFGRTK